MDRQILEFKSENEWLVARRRDITSTQSSVLIGINPYMSELQLWNDKKGCVADDSSNEWVNWGRRLESVIADAAAEKLGVSLRRLSAYIRIPSERIGSSFDYISDDGSFLVECKNVSSYAFRSFWSESNAPPHVEMQVQHQMLVHGSRKAYIAALVGGNQLVVIERDADDGVADTILKRCRVFWDGFDRGEQPAPSTEADYDLLIKKMPDADITVAMDISENSRIISDAGRYLAVHEKIRALEAEKKALKYSILDSIGSASRATGGGVTIISSMVPPGVTKASIRNGYRTFKVARSGDDNGGTDEQ